MASDPVARGLAAATFPGGAIGFSFSTAAAFQAANVGPNIQLVLVSGYHTNGVGGFTARRVASQPAHPWSFRTQDRFTSSGALDFVNGGWWEGVLPASQAVDVCAFGAYADGVHFDQAAIQAAINYVGITQTGYVALPSGTCNIQPSVAVPWAALYVNYNNVKIQGVEEGLSRLAFYCSDGNTPTNSWPVVAGAVLRGHGISLQAGVGTLTNFSIVNVELDGQGSYTGNINFPASTITGDGWDITNHAIDLQQNQNFDNIIIDDCYIHNWRGEPIYYGGAGLGHINVTNCKIGATNGDCLSFSSVHAFVWQNEFYQAAGAGVENYYLGGAGKQVYLDNIFRDMPRFAVGVGPASAAGPWGEVLIGRNIFQNCNTAINYDTIYLDGGKNTKVFDNEFIDCPGNCILVSAKGLGGSRADSIILDNVEISGNRFTYNTAGGYAAISINNNGLNFQNFIVRDNYASVTDYGVAHAVTFQEMISLNGATYTITNNSGVVIERNFAYKGTFEDHSQAKSDGTDWKLLTGVGQVGVAQMSCRRVTRTKCSVSLWVQNAATTVTMGVSWNYRGVWNWATPVNAVSLAPGWYSFELDVLTGGATGSCGITLQPSIANNVSYFAEITGW